MARERLKNAEFSDAKNMIKRDREHTDQKNQRMMRLLLLLLLVEVLFLFFSDLWNRIPKSPSTLCSDVYREKTRRLLTAHTDLDWRLLNEL